MTEEMRPLALSVAKARDAAALHLWDEGLVRPEHLGIAVVDALIATGWRPLRETVTDAEWEYAIWTAQDEHIWPLGPQDEEIAETLSACMIALDDNDPDYWEPTDRIVRRSKAGHWQDFSPEAPEAKP